MESIPGSPTSLGAKYEANLRDNDHAGDKRVVATVWVDRAGGYPLGQLTITTIS
jgi:hypothetical protein